MRVGIDLDNTIIDYDRCFFEVAKSLGFVDRSVAPNKEAVKQYMQTNNQSSDFTMLQGIVYGKEIKNAKLMDGFLDFLTSAISKKVEIFIISHKSQFPIYGEKVDLRKAALGFLVTEKVICKNAISRKNIFFADTKEQKIEIIIEKKLDTFIDDLPSILSHPKFPIQTEKLLFSPGGANINLADYKIFESWALVKKYFGSWS
jgi:hypothetical protein